MKEKLQGSWLRLLCWTILQCARHLPYVDNEEVLQSGFLHNLLNQDHHQMTLAETREMKRKFCATWSIYAVLRQIDGPLRIWLLDGHFRRALAEQKRDQHSDAWKRVVWDEARYIDWLQITEGGKRGWYCYLKALMK